MLPEDDRTQEEILSRGPTRPPVPGESGNNAYRVAWLPATLSFVASLLGFCASQIYAVLVGGWRWSVVGLILLLVGFLVGSCLQSYANRRSSY